jgi:nucleoside-diphosphate-sugar epimerase
MDVFVTGATGVLGRAVVPRLVAAGHRVRGLARSEANAALLRELGAEPVAADVYDVESLRTALAGAEAALHLATKIPPSNQIGKPAAWRENDRLRAAGTRALVDAALAAGVGVIVYPSIVFVYPDSGDAWIDAATPPASAFFMDSTLTAEAEVGRFTAAGGRGVVLRMGAFYGPDAGSTREQMQLARRGIAALVGSDEGYQPMIWVDDAATAVVAALSAPAGVYDVVDDEPLRRAELTAALAAAVGRRSLIRPPLAAARLLAGEPAVVLARSQRVSNRRFKEATGWAPTVPNARIGLAKLGEALPPESSAGGPPNRAWVRGGLAALALFGLLIGAWQQFAPRAFYQDFPGLGFAWVAIDGPYNEHLIRDIGGGNLALAVVALVALFRPSALLVRTVALTTLVAQVPHVVYHLVHIGLLPTALDQILQTISLGLLIVVPLLLLVGVAGWDRSTVAAGSRAGARSRPTLPRAPGGHVVG